MSNTEVEVTALPNCSFCRNVKAEYDGKTELGPWAYMCESCFRSVGIGLGLGKGQRLILRSTPKVK